jgi:uncharacterized protein (TIGR01244 family)
MADIRSVTQHFAVSGQIRPEEVADLGRRFALIINNRPDGEDPDQPAAADIDRAARDAGVNYVHIPVRGTANAAQIQQMRVALSSVRGEALAFCRSGTRSITTWALGEGLAGHPVEDLEAKGRAAGYDLGPTLGNVLPSLRAEQDAG